MFIGYVIISDLYLFQDIVLLNPYFKFSKNLMLSFITKVTTGSWSLVLAVMKFTPVMLLWCSINTQYFVHDKSSYTLNFINCKTRDLQKLLKCLSGIVSMKIKDDTSVWAGRSASPGFPGCGGLCGVSSTKFVLYTNGLPSETLSLTLTSTICSL